MKPYPRFSLNRYFPFNTSFKRFLIPFILICTTTSITSMYFSKSRSQESNSEDNYLNLKFYRNEIVSTPRGDFIDNIHKNWWGDYRLLEMHHGYIQWLFPEEMGVNYQASPLRKEEAAIMKKDPAIRSRVYKSFLLMLDFWGIEVEAQSGDPIEPEGRVFLKRTTDYKRRYDNWMGGHNNLRVTRCIKSLGRLGMEHLQPPFVEFLMHEIMDGQLRGCSSSMEDFWITSIVDENEKKRLSTIWKQWNKDKKRVFPQIQWKHSASCHDFSNTEGDSNLNKDNTSSLDSLQVNNDKNDIINKDDKSNKSNKPTFQLPTHREPIVVSDKIPFTPMATVDDSIFDVEPEKKRRRTESDSQDEL